MITYPLYLVPFDFSAVSENALELALELARKNSGSVYVLHVVESRKDKPLVRKRLNNYVETLDLEDQKLIHSNVIAGSVFEDVGKASEILRPALVVLGTHGAKGLQKIFGSHMDKMISNSSSPLLITQGNRKLDDIDNIILPFNFTKESLQVTSFACNIARKFNACVHLVAEHDSSDIHEEKTMNHQSIVKRFMEDNKVAYTIVHLPGKDSFDAELMEYAGNINADIIAATYSNDNFLGTTNMHMKRIIENDFQIPVLTYHSDELAQTYY